MYAQYTHIIEEMDAGELPLFNHILPPPIAMSYWKLGKKERNRDRETVCVYVGYVLYWEIHPFFYLFSTLHTYVHASGHQNIHSLAKTHTNIHTYAYTAPDASFRDLLLAIRKDEATHREVNHTFATLKEHDYNPYVAHQQYLSDVISKKQKK